MLEQRSSRNMKIATFSEERTRHLGTHRTVRLGPELQSNSPWPPTAPIPGGHGLSQYTFKSVATKYHWYYSENFQLFRLQLGYNSGSGGVAGDFGGCTEAKLLHDPVLVKFHSAGRHRQGKRDLLNLESFRQHLQYLALT